MAVCNNSSPEVTIDWRLYRYIFATMPGPIARKGSKKAWRPPFPPTPVTLVTKAVPIPEPKHRITPAGISSGMSLRSQPKTTVQKVQDICLHYVEKVSGKYESNQAAARYVHQMADEIIGQLGGVVSQLKSTRENKPENFQELLDEWHKHFPPSLGTIGTPRHVAATLDRYTKELMDLRNELESERSKRAQEVAGVLKSMDAQLQASSLGVMSERRQLSFAQQQQMEDFERTLKECETQGKSKLAILAQNYEDKMRHLQDDHNRRLKEVMKLTEILQEELREERSRSGSAIAGVEETRKREADKQSSMIAKLKEEMLIAQGVQSVPPSGVDGGLSTVSLSLDDSKERSNNSDEEKKTIPHYAAEKVREERLPKPKTKRQLAGPVAKAVKGLKEKIIALETELEASRQKVEYLENRLRPAEEERALFQRQVEELKETSEALRKALSMKLVRKVDDTGVLGRSLPHFHQT